MEFTLTLEGFQDKLWTRRYITLDTLLFAKAPEDIVEYEVESMVHAIMKAVRVELDKTKVPVEVESEPLGSDSVA